MFMFRPLLLYGQDFSPILKQKAPISGKKPGYTHLRFYKESAVKIGIENFFSKNPESKIYSGGSGGEVLPDHFRGTGRKKFRRDPTIEPRS